MGHNPMAINNHMVDRPLRVVSRACSYCGGWGKIRNLDDKEVDCPAGCQDGYVDVLE